MRSIAQRNAVLLFVAASIGGCGGSSGTGGPVAHDATGHTIQTAGGEAVSQEAHNRWQEGLAAFHDADAHGWNEARCADVSSKFEDAAQAQGGRFAEALYMAGVTLDHCNKHAEAIGFYNRALAANAHLCRARVAIGITQLDSGNLAAATASFTQSIHDDNQCTEGYVNLAIAQRRAGTPDLEHEALNNLRRALAIDAQYLPAFNEMAQLFLDEATQDPQRLDLAEVVCRQAQQINHDYAPIYNTWGLINVKQNNIIGALAKFERAFTLDNTMFEALMNFGEITIRFRGYEDAQRSFSRAVELEPNNFDAHIGLGAALRGLGQLDNAKAQYEAARNIDGNRPETYFNLALISMDFASGTEADLTHARDLFNQFLTKAGSNAQYSSAVEDVRRTCAVQQTSGRHHRRVRATCRPGRLQLIQQTIDALHTQAEAAAMGARIQAEAAAREAAEAAAQQQQQQQQQATPPPGGTTPTPGGATPTPGGATPAPGGATPAPAPSPAPAAGGGHSSRTIFRELRRAAK